MKDGFARVAYGTPPDTKTTQSPKLLARSEGITVQMAAQWQAAVSLSPLPDEVSVGVFHLDTEHHLLAHAQITDDDQPLTTYTRVPNTYLRDWHGNIRGIWESLRPTAAPNGSLPPVLPPTTVPWKPEEQRAALAGLLSAEAETLPTLLNLLDGVIRRERVLIYNAPPSVDARLGIIDGLMALLPACVRADLTFSTHITGQHAALNGRVVFAEQQQTSKRHQYNWAAHTFDNTPPQAERSGYVAQLDAAWDGDLTAFLAFIASFDPLADCLREADFISRLNNMTGRYVFNQRVQNDETQVSLEEIKAALRQTDVLPQPWRDHYTALLLDRALNEKDTEAHSLIAGEMDSNDELDATITEQLAAKLDDTPDLVYVFMRQRLSEGASERWQQRLHEAAAASLDVAFSSGDTELILSWLRLLAREPASFALRDVIESGVQRAIPYAYEDSDFALKLLLLAARFVADLLDDLLDDEKLLAALTSDVRDAFAYFERDALAELQTHGSSLFLAGMGRAAAARAGAAFEAGVLERIWALYKGEKKFNTRSPYTPENILLICVETGAEWLPSTAVETLLGLLLNERDDELYDLFTEHLADDGSLAERLPNALLRGGVNVNKMLDAVTPLVAAKRLSNQNTLNVYITVLDRLEWAKETQPMTRAVGRVLAQNNGTSLPLAKLDTLLARSAALQDEPTSKTAALALIDASADEDDEVFLPRIINVFSQLAWSSTARNAVLQRWRTFIQTQPSGRLSRLDDALTGVRVMEDALETLRSVEAMRRLIGKRDVESFTDAINTAYEIMQTLAEAFEPDERHSDISFDPETVRDTLMHMANELSPHQRQILGNSLKGLAGLIAQMGDNRTKAGIARRSASLDRQLITGEQMPGGAVDAMKWMAGFFSGAQADEDEEG